MERRSKAISIGTIDELSLVKAAAWAWYQHGSSHESKHMMQEYHDNISSWKTKKAPRPSRYKLEAMKQVQENSVSQLSCHVHVQDDNDNDTNSLLDSYEIGRISRDLDCYIEASHAKNCQNLRCHYKKLSSGRSGTRSISHVRSKKICQ
ncbi:hypothetical protein Leryth_002451 [Lithospermum erythrorhizon]|nr:hypothetical protein Leryth_002451 [Lithospermum erythrorhizon]